MVILVFFETVACSPCWPQTLYIVKIGLELLILWTLPSRYCECRLGHHAWSPSFGDEMIKTRLMLRVLCVQCYDTCHCIAGANGSYPLEESRILTRTQESSHSATPYDGNLSFPTDSTCFVDQQKSSYVSQKPTTHHWTITSKYLTISQHHPSGDKAFRTHSWVGHITVGDEWELGNRL